ncbi:MAG: hypothetical protein GX220_07780 [Treponema sp.]|nr:hypothetical protein [Treponema sp.]
MEPIEVEVEKGRICYGGTLDINVIDRSKYFPKFLYRYRDTYDASIAEFTNLYPVLSKEFSFKNSFSYHFEPILERKVLKQWL